MYSGLLGAVSVLVRSVLVSGSVVFVRTVLYGVYGCIRVRTVCSLAYRVILYGNSQRAPADSRKIT